MLSGGIMRARMRSGGMRSGGSRRSRLIAAQASCGLALATLAISATLIASAPSPARADSVRDAEQWVLGAINAPAAWQVSEGSGVTVAVIDSGVNGDVPDLKGSVRSGPDLTGVRTSPGDPNWGMHGTWMASLIAGHGHGGGIVGISGLGIVGVAPQSKILSVRVITDKLDPGYAAYERQPLSRGQLELAEAIRYAVAHGAGVISMSLGYGAPSLPVRAALQDAYDHNVVVVASSGNSGDAAEAAGNGSAPYSFPAVYPGVIGVSAVGPDGRPAAFSSDNLSVTVAAPGVNVPAEGRDSQYWLVSGTSPACALTAGVVALIKSRYPRLGGAEVAEAITTSAWHRPPGGYDRQVGLGTVDAVAALAAARRLARRGQSSRAVSATSHFGGGPSAVPAPPVQSRGALALILYCLLGAASLGLIGVAATRLVAFRQGSSGSGAEPPGVRRPAAPTPGWGLLTRDDDDIDPGPAPGDEPGTDLTARDLPGSDLPGSDLPGSDLPGTDLPGTDLPGTDLPGRDLPGSGLPPGSARFPWQSPSAGRHAAPSDRGGRAEGSG
jgi:Subtilase family